MMGSKKSRLFGLLPVLALALGAFVASPARAAEEPGGDKPSRNTDLVLKGDAVCTSCHDETEAYPVLSIGKTRHGVVADARTPTCTGCHGESKAHLDKPKGVRVAPKPDIVFGKRTATPVEQQNETCIACHKGGKHIHWAGSTHQAHDVACASCHQLHVAHDPVRDKLTQSEVCFACHKEQRAEISRPSRHPVKEGKVACSDCHNAHGGAGPMLMVRDSVNETCYTCHMEKRGPFVWNHQPVTEDCSICHNPHGTTADHLLKARAPFLCQQCHEPTGHRGGIPSVTGLSSFSTSGRGATLARSCMNCHTQIHGSNNPADGAAGRIFQH